VNELADAGGGHVTQEPDGMATIDFTSRPGPGGAPYIPPFSTAPVTVSRMPSLADATSAVSGLRDQAVDAGRGAVDHGVQQAQQLGDQAIEHGSQYAHDAVDHATSAVRDATGLGAGSPEDAKAKADEMYEEMLRRLRRDLLTELEGGGHLLRYDS
jgi:hypothetical protein